MQRWQVAKCAKLCKDRLSWLRTFKLFNYWLPALPVWCWQPDIRILPQTPAGRVSNVLTRIDAEYHHLVIELWRKRQTLCSNRRAKLWWALTFVWLLFHHQHQQQVAKLNSRLCFLTHMCLTLNPWNCDIPQRKIKKEIVLFYRKFDCAIFSVTLPGALYVMLRHYIFRPVLFCHLSFMQSLWLQYQCINLILSRLSMLLLCNVHRAQ